MRASRRNSLRHSFNRRFVSLNQGTQNRAFESGDNRNASLIDEECTALVINSSFTMAKEITLAITLKMPNCSIMYAPGFEIAKWILKRRKISLIVASPVLPDGQLSSLIPVCEKLTPPPDLVVVGDITDDSFESQEVFERIHDSIKYFGEAFEEIKEVALPRPPPAQSSAIKKLGADIRNDLNNPLQEIVSMVFVAKAGSALSSTTVQALEAIDRAARGMATTVNGIEGRIETLKAR